MEPIFGWLIFCAITFLALLVLTILASWWYEASSDSEVQGLRAILLVLTALTGIALAIVTMVASFSSGGA